MALALLESVSTLQKMGVLNSAGFFFFYTDFIFFFGIFVQIVVG